jgi:hypothetical protein
MRYLCLIHFDEAVFGALPDAERDALNAGHVALNEELKRSGHFIEAEALAPVAETKHVRREQGRARVVDGPYAESKEVIAGFYLIEAGSMDEALSIAERMPGGRLGAVEVRPTVRLTVDGVEVW